MADPAPDTGNTTSPSGGDTAWTASLPEAIRGHDAWKGMAGVGDLATKYLDTQRPLAERLPKDIAAEAAFKDIKTDEAMARSYLAAQKMIGIPKDQLLRITDKPEDLAVIYNRLGRPEKPEGYEIKPPDGGTIDPETGKSLYARAHELGVSQKQLQGLYDWLAEGAAAAQAATESRTTQKIAEGMALLKRDYGLAYDQKVADAEGAVQILDQKYPGIKDALYAVGLGQHPALHKFFADYAGTLKEDGQLIGRDTGSTRLNSPVEAQQQIAALKQDPNFMAQYLNRANSGHKEAVEKMQRLYQQAHPPVQAA